MNAIEILKQAQITIGERGAARDLPEGERSMRRTVEAFRVFTGICISERDGWLFMALLKIARATSNETGTADDYLDLSAYGALAGECAARFLQERSAC